MSDNEKRLRAEILKYVAGHPGASFAELYQIEGFAPEEKEDSHCVQLGEHNIILWPDCSSDAATAIIDLVNNGEICGEPTTYMTYMVDGRVPDMPIAKQARNYSKPHWLPITLSAKKPSKEAQGAS